MGAEASPRVHFSLILLEFALLLVGKVPLMFRTLLLICTVFCCDECFQKGTQWVNRFTLSLY